MKIFRHIILVLIVTLLISCDKKGCMNQYAKNFNPDAEKEDCSCIAYVDEMEGTFNIIVTSYPRQPSQEGEKKDILVFNDHAGCNSREDTDFNKIRFNNLFTFYGCDEFTLYDKYYFEVILDHNVEWSGAPVSGIGSIINNIFHFEGTVYTSAGEFPIILDGTKTSNDRRTSAC